MKLFIPQDIFNNPQPPRIFLCNTGKKILGELPAYDVSLDGKWNSYSEVTFSIDRQYTDVLTGETKINPLFDKAEGLRKVYVENIGYFVIQDPNAMYTDRDSKTLSCFSTEYETGNKYLENFRVNTGETDSKEVIYESSRYGDNATVDQMYKLANYNDYDSNQDYYHRVYSDNDSYDYELIQIIDEAAYKAHFGEDMHPEDILYIHGYANVQFYDPYTPELSLLHLILEKTPEWTIGDVDATLWHKERKFDEDRIAVYDFLMNDVADTFNCVIEWDTIKNKINFYEEADDGITDNNEVQTRFETDVFISRENLANEINIQYSTDDIKTKLKVSGSDDLNIREVNLDNNYIMNLSFYHTPEWMEPDLFEAYDDYLEMSDEAMTGKDKFGNPSIQFPMSFTSAVQGWVAANNKWNDLMNAVPAEGNVVLVGDEFKKLYCLYTPIDTAYVDYTITSPPATIDVLYLDEQGDEEIVASNEELFVVQGYAYVYNATENTFKYKSNLMETNLTGKDGLNAKLTLYQVNKDTRANISDNILLRLKNANNDVATIRLYNSELDENKTPIYKIQVLLINNTSGIESTHTYDLSSWIKGNLTTANQNSDGLNYLSGFTVNYIGVMGAYFVLAKDEKNPINLQDYGVALLQAKEKTYTTIFQTQTEAMYSDENYQCVASDLEPTEPIPEGTRWLDTDATPLILYKRTDASATANFNTRWVSVETDANPADLANYQRYIDNYEKLQAVQQVLSEKKRQAEYMLNGFAVSDSEIDVGTYDDTYHSPTGSSLEGDMHRAAERHFEGYNTAYLPITLSSADINKTIDYLYSSPACTEDYLIDKSKLSHGHTFIVQGYTFEYDLTNKWFKCIKNDFYITRKDMNPVIPIYEFYVTKYPQTTFAVYLKGKTPYVSYVESQGVYQTMRDYINQKVAFENFFTEEQWIRLSPFIREDEFTDDNFLLTGYESEEERMEICQELMEAATKELNSISQPSLEFSMNMANILALPEFKSLINQFQLGNFVRVHIRDGYVKRARLLEVHLKFDDLSDFSCSFGNLITTKSEIDKHAELLQQAVTAGKQVATSAGEWQRAVDQSNKLEEEIANGLQNAALEIGRASGQNITWNEQGIRCKKLIEGTTDQYEDEQIAIINNKIVFTNNNWKTSKAALGEFTIELDGRKQNMYGLLADAVVSGYIQGSVIKGGSLEIGGTGGKFVVHEDGSVQILGPDSKTPVYATQDTVDLVSQARQYHTELIYSGSTIFSEPNSECTITCKIYDWEKDITQDVIQNGGTFSWIRNSSVDNTLWNNSHANMTTNIITITNEDVVRNAQFSCQCTFDETKLS